MRISLLICSCILIGWTVINDPLKIKTEKGIVITISQKALLQYQRYWGLNPDNIQWDDIDVFAEKLAQAYGVDFKPASIKISISLFDENWVDNEAPVNADGTVGREMAGNHWDGIYGPPITIHLGDDSAQGSRAWCQTALDYELGHHFLRAKGDPCWYYEFSGSCPSH